MANPLYNALSGQQMPQGMQGMLQAFQQFKAGFSGDPRQQVQQLLDSGRMTQAQYNQLSQMAQSLMKFIK